tara:strand:- start:7 stop:618 length:612 start_codon:yes stop_codon:yes gene_type:complete
MKRGSIHVDWVVSIGIFLVYLLVLIVFIKPSYQPEFEGEFLASVVKTNFMKENQAEIQRNLITLKVCEEESVYSSSGYHHKLGEGKYFKFVGDVSDKPLEEGDLTKCLAHEGEDFIYSGLKGGYGVSYSNDLKNTWGFPINKEFQIFVYQLNGDTWEVERELGYAGENPGDVEIYSFDFSDAVISLSSGEVVRKPILINIRVW